MNDQEYKEAVITLFSKAIARDQREEYAQRMSDNLFLNPNDYEKEN